MAPPRDPPAPPQSPAQPRAAQSEGTEFIGIVRDLQQREERDRNTEVMTIWGLRIERHDAGGNRLAAVPVEMRGFSFSGALTNGDQVRVRGKWKDGTLHVAELDNLTTGAQVHVKRNRGSQIVLGIVYAIICAFILAIPLGAVFSMCSGRP